MALLYGILCWVLDYTQYTCFSDMEVGIREVLLYRLLVWTLHDCMKLGLLVRWFIIVGRAWASRTLIYQFVTAQRGICHTQVDVSTSHMPTARAATVSVTTYGWTKLYTLKSWAEFLAFINAVYAWTLPEATSTTVVIEICTACG